MRILAIETSCDETALCYLDASGTATDPQLSVLASAIASQTEAHVPYGGVYPNVARREHSRNLVPLLEQVLREANVFTPTDAPNVSKETIGTCKEQLAREPELFARFASFVAQTDTPPLDAIAVTHGPGLEPALWTGINLAQALSTVWHVPVIPVHHMEGHITAAHMEADGRYRRPAMPEVSLLVSGGHTELILQEEPFTYTYLGQTRDDAVGEAFDKVARLLEQPYPGGPAISALAQQAREQDLPRDFTLPRPMLDSDNYDFSFSGIKTAVLYTVREHESLSDTQRQQLAREFEEAVTDVLIAKTVRAIDAYDPRTVSLGGGVAANQYLRERLQAAAANADADVTVAVPELSLATDNAVMVGATAARRALASSVAANAVPADQLSAHARGRAPLPGPPPTQN